MKKRYVVPLRFRRFTPLMERRVVLKKLIHDNIDVSRNKGLDTLIKTIINAIYGVLSSAHFKISSTVVANNVEFLCSMVLSLGNSIIERCYTS